jgi:hypothetical protein
MDVLDHEEDGRLRTKTGEQAQQQLEQTRPRHRLHRPRHGGRRRTGSAELGHEPGKLVASRTKQLLQPVGREFTPETSQHRADRRVGKLLPRQHDALAGERPGAARLGLAFELVQQPALAHPRLAGEKDRGEPIPTGALKRIEQDGELGPAPNQLRARNAPRHPAIISGPTKASEPASGRDGSRGLPSSPGASKPLRGSVARRFRSALSKRAPARRWSRRSWLVQLGSRR